MFVKKEIEALIKEEDKKEESWLAPARLKLDIAPLDDEAFLEVCISWFQFNETETECSSRANVGGRDFGD